MYLKKLEIHGFKSFAKKTVFEFEPGITSVVGPNGSGKSNIADALRWVFGEQSMKLLRGKKAPDVIFAGSDHKARLGLAEAMVFFDNTDHKMPIDYEEVVVARRVFRDGNSEYLINNNVVRLLDIEELLVRSGFANTAYCIIGQGMIDQLVLGGPAAVKELLEEASGVKPYYLKRERTLRRLERTESNLEQVLALVKEIEPRLRSLKRQTKRLEARAELEAELEEAQILYYSQILRGFNHQIQEVSAKLKIFETQTQELNLEIKNLSKEIEIQERETETGGAKYQKLKKDLELFHKEKLEIQEELAQVKGELRALEGKREVGLVIDWQDLKNKFEQAYAGFLELLGNYTPEKALAVQKLFAGVDEVIKKAGQDIAGNTLELQEKEKELLASLEVLLGKIKILEEDIAAHTSQEEDVKRQLFVKERLLRNKQETLLKTSEQKNLLAVERAKLLTRKEGSQTEVREALGPNFQEKLQAGQTPSTPAGLQEKIQQLKKQLSQIGGVDEMVQQEYKESEERYRHLTSQSQDLEKAVKDLKTAILELDQVIKKEFHEAFVNISEKFSEYFRILFSGGKATMNLVREQSRVDLTNPDAENVTETFRSQDGSPKPFPTGHEISGIEIHATPPGKKLAGISALSGGERALASIALLCAILAAYPSPFVVLDEVDAALDEANSIRFGKILGTLAHKTQFITITHNRETMRQSHTLYGVTMGEDGVSKVLSLKLEQAAAYSEKN